MRVIRFIFPLFSASLVTSRNLLFSGKSQSALSQDATNVDVPGKSPLTYCEDPKDADYILDIDYINITPNPPLIGKKLLIEAKGTLSEDVEDGAYINLKVSYGLIKLVEQTISLCDQVGNVDLECPLKKGPVNITKEANIPNEAPPGQYTVTADVYTVDNDKITCLLGNKIPMHRS